MTMVEQRVITAARLVLAAYDLMAIEMPDDFRPHEVLLREAIEALNRAELRAEIDMMDPS